MSKGTDALKLVMDAHTANMQACQAANSAHAVACVNFEISSKQVDEAIAIVTDEAKQLAEDAAKEVPKSDAVPTPDSALPPPRPKEDVVSDPAPVITPTLPA